MALKPEAEQLSIVHSADDRSTDQAQRIRWDKEKQHLIIEAWADTPPRLSLKILPLSHP
jgi:hypothetical protein